MLWPTGGFSKLNLRSQILFVANRILKLYVYNIKKQTIYSKLIDDSEKFKLFVDCNVYHPLNSNRFCSIITIRKNYIYFFYEDELSCPTTKSGFLYTKIYINTDLAPVTTYICNFDSDTPVR